MTEGAPKVKNLSEHLKEGVKPIVTCLGTPKDYEDAPGYKFPDGQGSATATNVDTIYNPNSPEKVNLNVLNAGQETYAISMIDSLDKYSKGFICCTGLVVVGKDKVTGKNISFLTHQNPKHFLYEK